MVDVWYPAESSNSVPADYLDVVAYEKAMGADGFQNFFREASETIKQGVNTHAFAAVPYARSAEQSPVLIFSPGGGMVREVYAAQLEDLASHGYVVAAISHPYDAIMTLIPDGRQIAYSKTASPPLVIPSGAEGSAVSLPANDLPFHNPRVHANLIEFPHPDIAKTDWLTLISVRLEGSKGACAS